MWGRVLAVLDSPVVREEAKWSSTPRCNPPPGSAGSTCAHRLRGLPQPPVFFRPKERGLRKITLGRILTERCEPDSSQQEQGKSQMALHLNEPTTMVSTVPHTDGWSFLELVVITAHLSQPVANPFWLGVVQVYLRQWGGGVGFCGRSRPAELEGRRRLLHLPALHLRG